MKLQMTPKFPSNVTGRDGDKVTIANSAYTIGPDYSTLVSHGQIAPADLAREFLRLWNSSTLVYDRISYTDFIAGVSAINNFIFNTFAEMLVHDFPTGSAGAITLGYAVAFDGGGASYKFVTGVPSHPAYGQLTTGVLAGKYAELSVNAVDTKMTGGVATASNSACTQAIADALTYASVKAVPLVITRSYNLTTTITIPDNVVIEGNDYTIFRSAFTADAINVGDNVYINRLRFNGSALAGRVYVIANTKFRQYLQDCWVTNVNGNYCLECVGTGAGSGMIIDGGIWQRVDFLNSAIKFPNDGIVAAERKIVNVDTEGGFLLETDSCQNTGIDNCAMLSMSFTNTPQKLRMTNCRVASGFIGDDLHVRGSDHSFSSNIFSDGVTLEAGCSGVRIDDSNVMVGTITDSSGGLNNYLDYSVAFTPTWTASGGGAAIGNGTLTGRLFRKGKKASIQISFTPGSTTNFGASGTWSFALPAPYNVLTAKADYAGAVWALDFGTSFLNAVAFMQAATVLVVIASNGGANVWGPTVPMTWQNGDYFRLSLEYEVG